MALCPQSPDSLFSIRRQSHAVSAKVLDPKIWEIVSVPARPAMKQNLQLWLKCVAFFPSKCLLVESVSLHRYVAAARYFVLRGESGLVEALIGLGTALLGHITAQPSTCLVSRVTDICSS